MKKALRLFFILIGTILLVMFLIPIVFIGIINAGNLAGMMFSATIILCSVYITHVLTFFRNLCKKVRGKVITAILCLGVCCFSFLGIYSSLRITSKFSVPPTEPTVVVVLGCKVNPNGPSIMLQSRINAAYNFLKSNPDTKCIVSGGMGSDEHMSEALCMYNELTTMGIEKERIYIEDESTNTKENIAYSLSIIENEKLPHSITIITNEFHQYRASQIASKHGLKTYHVSGKTPFFLFPTYFLREIGGVVLELIF